MRFAGRTKGEGGIYSRLRGLLFGLRFINGDLLCPDQNEPMKTERWEGWPIRRLGGWTERVNKPLTQGELDSVRLSLRRSRPFGSDEWIEETCERTGLWSTTRPRGRPLKRIKPSPVQPDPN